MNAPVDPFMAIFKSKKNAAHAGPLSQLKVVKDALLHYIFELCKQGIRVNTFMIVLKASLLTLDIREKNFTVHCSAVKHFFVAHLFAYYMGTHTSQRPPTTVKSDALDCM